MLLLLLKNEVKISKFGSMYVSKGYKGYLSEDQILKGKLEPTNEGYALADCIYKLCNYINEINFNILIKTMMSLTVW